MPATSVTRIVGFDFGKQRIGVATGNTISGTATPLTTVHAINHKVDWTGIERILKEWKPQRVIVGRPLHKDGTSSELTDAAEKFARQLQGRFQCEIRLVDERFSSVEAEGRYKMMRQMGEQRADKSSIDALSAQIIVERWLQAANYE